MKINLLSQINQFNKSELITHVDSDANKAFIIHSPGLYSELHPQGTKECQKEMRRLSKFLSNNSKSLAENLSDYLSHKSRKKSSTSLKWKSPQLSLVAFELRGDIINYFVSADLHYFSIDQNNHSIFLSDEFFLKKYLETVGEISKIHSQHKKITLKGLNRKMYSYLKKCLNQTNGKHSFSALDRSANRDLIDYNFGRTYVKPGETILIGNLALLKAKLLYKTHSHKNIAILASKNGLSSVAESIHSIENKDPSGKKYPRLSQNSPFAALAFSVSK